VAHRACAALNRNGGSEFNPAFQAMSARLAPRRTAMFVRLFAFVGFLAFLAGAPQTLVAQEQITVFAAASLKNALDDTNAAFTKATGVKVTVSYAASSALAKQVEQGAPADIFISADLQWMDYVGERKLIKPDTRVNLLGNKLVLIAPADSKIANVTIGPGFDIAKLAGSGRIAVANVNAVPAGRYAKAALEKLGAWAAAEPKLAQAENVRATLAFVARDETPIGIVYETDAKVEPKVKVIGAFPEGSYPPVNYPVAATVITTKQSVSQYLLFLRSPVAKAIFEKYGFSFLIRPVS
jgi:molybdate transport system substrate-binding protein